MKLTSERLHWKKEMKLKQEQTSLQPQAERQRTLWQQQVFL
jgi:hypothetical protein